MIGLTKGTFYGEPQSDLLAVVRKLLSEHPCLWYAGFRAECRTDTSSDCIDQFLADESRPSRSDFLQQIQAVIAYCKQSEDASRLDSYSFKHEVENWCALGGERRYVSNGCAILGAMLSGYGIKRELNSPNCRFIRKSQ
jgi:hypothetical protein